MHKLNLKKLKSDLKKCKRFKFGTKKTKQKQNKQTNLPVKKTNLPVKQTILPVKKSWRRHLTWRNAAIAGAGLATAGLATAGARHAIHHKNPKTGAKVVESSLSSIDDKKACDTNFEELKNNLPDKYYLDIIKKLRKLREVINDCVILANNKNSPYYDYYNNMVKKGFDKTYDLFTIPKNLDYWDFNKLSNDDRKIFWKYLMDPNPTENWNTICSRIGDHTDLINKEIEKAAEKEAEKEAEKKNMSEEEKEDFINNFIAKEDVKNFWLPEFKDFEKIFKLK